MYFLNGSGIWFLIEKALYKIASILYLVLCNAHDDTVLGYMNKMLFEEILPILPLPKEDVEMFGAEDLMKLVFAVASGVQTKTEERGFREISIFKDGVTL